VNRTPPTSADEPSLELGDSLPESKIEDARHLRKLGDEAYRDADAIEAERAYEQAAELDPTNVRSLHNLGVLYYNRGEYGRAHETFTKALDREPRVADMHFKIGLTSAQTGNREEARLSFDRATHIDPDHLDAYFQLALHHAHGAAPASKDRQKAIDALEHILARCDEGVHYEGLDRVCFLLGSFLDDFPDRGRHAVDIYRRGLEADPFFAPGHNNLGVLLMQAGQTISALGEFKIAIQLQPDYALPYRNLATLLFDQMSPSEMEQEYATISEEFSTKASTVLARLSLELIELGRAQVYESLYTHGHRIKNLMGLAGNKLRRAIRHLDPPASEPFDKILAEQESVYDQWVTYLRSMKAETVNATLVDVVDLTRRTIEASGGPNISFKSEEHVPRVKADTGMIAETVTNLLVNALAASRDDQPVRVQVGYDPAGTTVYIEVEDRGTGIPEDIQPRIFDPGFSTSDRGNGYGLSICRRIVAAHRGTIRFQSSVGRGTVFRVDLPIDFEVQSEKEALRLQRSNTETGGDPVADEFIT
jgi:signal transduction histidine kinase